MGADSPHPAAAPSGSSMDAEGLVAGKYRVFADIGRGGMADVYLASARGPMGWSKLVVVKRLRASLNDDPLLTSMFLDEARLAARLNHSNVIHTYEVGKYDGGLFIAMEYLEGQSLASISGEAARRDEPVHPNLWARICAEALCGLHYAHELKDYDGTPLHIIHRDISPHNVMVTYEGEVKVVDFGIAKAAINTTVTENNTIKGKVAYMAPEQAEGRPIDRRADVFAMGVVLWGLLTGERLFPGDAIRALDKLRNGRIERVSELVDVPDELDDIVAKALDRDPAKRFQTAQQMGEALERYIERTGEYVRTEAIASLVSGLFKDRREEIQEQIRQYMAQQQSSPSMHAIAVLSLAGTASDKSRSGRRGRVRAGPGDRTETGIPDVKDATPLATHSSPSRSLAVKRTGTLALTMAGVGVAAVLAILVVVSGGGPSARSGSAGSAAPASAAAATTAATATTTSAPPPATASAVPAASAPPPAASSAAPRGSAPIRTGPPAMQAAPKPTLDPDPWR